MDFNDPQLWYGLSVLFALTGIVNLVRGRKHTDRRRTLRFTLGISCFFWAATALLFRLVHPSTIAYITAVIAFCIMVYGAFLSAKHTASQ